MTEVPPKHQVGSHTDATEELPRLRVARRIETVPTVPTLRPLPARTTVPDRPGQRPSLSVRLLSWPAGARWYRPILALWALVLQQVLYNNSGYSWHFFADASALLFGQHPPGDILSGGLHLYANYPAFQFGPLTLLAAAVMGLFGSAGWMIVVGTMTLCGFVVLYLLELLVGILRPDVGASPRAAFVTMLVGGASFLTSWELLAVHFGHLDDILALVLLAATALTVVAGDATVAGLCAGLAVDAKPWALACVALLLVLPGRARLKAGLVAAGTIAVAWLPFVIADPHTLSATASFTIPNVSASALRALGIDTSGTPSWDRIAQVGLGCVLGVVAIVRRRPVAIIALGIGARLLLDPSVYTYYTAGLAMGLLLWDLTGYATPVPLLSVVCLLGISGAEFVLKDPRLLGELRLWTVLLAIAVMLAAPLVDGPRPPALLHSPQSG